MSGKFEGSLLPSLPIALCDARYRNGSNQACLHAQCGRAAKSVLFQARELWEPIVGED